jgi:teichoic acid transport system ATP-binding protein
VQPGSGRPVAILRRMVTGTRSPAIREVHAVKSVSFTAYRNEAIVLIDSNGSGKSTLLRAIAGLLPVDRGAIYTRGQPSLLGVNAALLNDLSGERNAVLGCRAMGMTRADARRRAPPRTGEHGVLRHQRAGRLRLAADADVLLGHGRPAAFRDRRGQAARRAADRRGADDRRRPVPAPQRGARAPAARGRGHGPTDDVIKEYEAYMSR